MCGNSFGLLTKGAATADVTQTWNILEGYYENRKSLSRQQPVLEQESHRVTNMLPRLEL
jgi:hypothetical protein